MVKRTTEQIFDEENEENIDRQYKRGEKLFNEASKKINGERQTQYGSPENSFSFIAVRWNQYIRGRFNIEIELKDVDIAFMMADFKMARECYQGKRDNTIDAVGYLGIHDDMRDK